MQSMTGFGQGVATHATGSLTIQIASVNHRGIQIQIRSDLRDLGSDEQIRGEVRKALERGAITVQVRAISTTALALDKERLAAAWRDLAALASELGAPAPSLERVASMLPTATNAGTDTALSDQVAPALATALAALRAERIREGTALAASFCLQAAQLRALVPPMREAAAARLSQWRELLVARLKEILAERAIPEEILVRELAIYADRVDVSEEFTRLAAHLDALDRLIAEPDRADSGQGRRLEFLLQELGREINTTGAKSNDTALTGMVLEAKSLIEQMKEQAANVL